MQRQTLLVLLCLLFFGIGLVSESPYWGLMLSALMLSGLYLKIADVFLVGLICTLTVTFCKLESINRLWPLPILLALVIVLVVGKLVTFTRGAFNWIKKGDWGRQQIAIIAIVATVSGISLVCWYLIVKPDIADLADTIPHVHPIILIMMGVLFAITNAICEEFIWRGIIFNAWSGHFYPVQDPLCSGIIVRCGSCTWISQRRFRNSSCEYIRLYHWLRSTTCKRVVGTNCSPHFRGCRHLFDSRFSRSCKVNIVHQP